VEYGSRVVTTRARKNGKWALTARLPEGATAARVLSVDRAGNATAAARRVTVDTLAPRLSLSGLKDIRVLTKTDEPVIYGSVPNEAPGGLVFGATVNGNRVAPVAGRNAGVLGNGSDLYTEAAATTGTTGLQLQGRRFALRVGRLPQGRNRITVWVKDRAGNVSRKSLTSFVDTTSEFGSHAMVRGAKGADVTTLQERLREAGTFRGKATAVYDKKTMLAVRAYQRKNDMPVNGQVSLRTLDNMVGKIVIDLSSYSLKLVRDGRAVKSYRVAVGQAAYPTPTGTFEVVDKQVDPAWFPPDSPWARGLGPIPPGPGNPLGTRWIGTSAPAIGIHGTYADYSIGTAASHGCIRMHIPQVEELFDEVTVGMKVTIQA
jgi:lipoprotein-anchoring transpeptidase ErfK/SrfK